jgi:hypothetical protein
MIMSHLVPPAERRWARAILWTAATYNILWGAIAVLIPVRLLGWMASGSAATPFSLQIIGVVTFSLGLAYALASFDPMRQWVVSTAGFVFSLLCSVAYWAGLRAGVAEPAFVNVVISNWVVWVPLFGMVLWFIYRRSYDADEELIETFSSEGYPLDLFETTDGEDLLGLSRRQPVLLVFLRHFGCPFCKDTLDHIAKVHREFERCGTRVVLVYMVEAAEAREHLMAYGLEGLTQISDPESMLYKRFQLRRGRIGQLFGPKALWRAAQLWWGRGYRIGGEVGDSLQMPGVFLLDAGRVTAGFVHESAADRPDYDRLLSVCCR